jgi:TPP-dependent 2-oxoacid decarboxylase
MSVIKAALGSVHGVDVIEQQLSGYYLSNEISGIYPGMMIAIEYEHWHVFQRMTIIELVKLLKKLAARVNLSKFKKSPRGPKKPQPKRIAMKNKPHVSTAKLLEQRKK